MKSRCGWIAILVIAASASPVAADVPIHAPGPPNLNTADGVEVTRAAYAAQPKGCMRDGAAAAAHKKLDELAPAIARIKDPQSRDRFTQWIATTRAWIDAHARGIPGLATYAELDKARADSEAVMVEYDRLPPWPKGQPKIPEHLHKTVDVYIRVVNASDAVTKYSSNIDNKSPCDAYVKTFKEVAWKLVQLPTPIRRMANSLSSNTMIEAGRWKPNIKYPDGAPPTDYWGHVTYVMSGIDAIRKARDLHRQVTAVVPLGPLLDAEPRKLLSTVPAELAAAIADWEPKALAELAKVEMPPMSKDAARANTLLRALNGNTAGTQVGPITTGGAVSKQQWTEQVIVKREVNGVWVRDVKKSRDYYSVYYAWKPTPETAGAPELPGAPAICEIWTMAFSRSGGGSFAAGESWRLGYLPCENTTKVSKRKS